MDYAAQTITLAMLFGALGMAAAHHLRLPGVLVLLGMGVMMGPDGFGWVRPNALDDTMFTVVGLAVAIILFDGALHLNIRVMRRQALVIRRLLSVGVVVTVVAATGLARLLLEWPWRQSLLFGTLVVVTGPTVIAPLLRTMRLRSSLATILEAEGVFVDAIGAVLAVVAMEAATLQYGPGVPWMTAALQFLLRIGGGAAIGLVAGALLDVLLKRPGLIPARLVNVLTLATLLALFVISNRLVHEMGIVSVIAFGLVVGNTSEEAVRRIRTFKQQLTTLLIGMLFVLLAADVRLESVQSLSRSAFWVVLALMFIVRPLAVALSTFGSDLGPRERLFLAWFAPRGIVAAAVASFFADVMERAGHPGGQDMRALVFLVIASTVCFQGISGKPIARLLGLTKKGV